LYLVRLTDPPDGRVFGTCACLRGQQIRRDARLAYLWLLRAGEGGPLTVKPLEQLLERDELPAGFLDLLAEITPAPILLRARGAAQ
jgi:hypothetical protein